MTALGTGEMWTFHIDQWMNKRHSLRVNAVERYRLLLGMGGALASNLADNLPSYHSLSHPPVFHSDLSLSLSLSLSLPPSLSLCLAIVL